MEIEVKRRTAKALVRKLSSVSEHTRTEALCELRLISKHDPDSRSLIAESGAIPYLAEILYSMSQISQENATATLLNLSISSREPLMSTRGLLDALSHALRNPTSPSTAQCAAATVYSLLTEESYRPIIGHKRDIIFSLIDIVKNPSSPPRSVKDALKALFGVALYPLNRGTMIELGAVSALFALVMKDGRVGIVEDATAVIAQIAGCEEAKDAFKKVSGIGVLVDLLDSSTGSTVRTKENSVSALLNLVQCGGEEVANSVREMDFCVFDGIADVAENGSEKGKRKAVALLKALGVGSIDLQDPRIGVGGAIYEIMHQRGNISNGDDGLQFRTECFLVANSPIPRHCQQRDPFQPTKRWLELGVTKVPSTISPRRCNEFSFQYDLKGILGGLLT